MNAKKSRGNARDILVLIGLLLLACLVLGLWPILLIALCVMLAYALWALALQIGGKDKPELMPDTAEPREVETEQTVQYRAFCLLLRRITECVLSKYPDARWVWGTPQPFDCFKTAKPLTILLGSADGCRAAEVRTHNLVLVDVVFGTGPHSESTTGPASADDEPNEADDTDALAENYELLAFEWVEANLLYLNEQCNSAIACGDTILLIPASKLPHQESWPDVCGELLRNGFLSAEPGDDGIQVHLPQ